MRTTILIKIRRRGDMKSYRAIIEDGKYVRTYKASKKDTEHLNHDVNVDVDGVVKPIAFLNEWKELKNYARRVLVRYEKPLQPSSDEKEALVRSIRLWEYMVMYGGNKYSAHAEIGAGPVNIAHNQCGLCHYLNHNPQVDEINEKTCTEFCPVNWREEFPDSLPCDEYRMPCEVKGTPYWDHLNDKANKDAAKNMVKVLKKSLNKLEDQS